MAWNRAKTSEQRQQSPQVENIIIDGQPLVSPRAAKQALTIFDLDEKQLPKTPSTPARRPALKPKKQETITTAVAGQRKKRHEAQTEVREGIEESLSKLPDLKRKSPERARVSTGLADEVVAAAEAVRDVDGARFVVQMAEQVIDGPKVKHRDRKRAVEAAKEAVSRLDADQRVALQGWVDRIDRELQVQQESKPGKKKVKAGSWKTPKEEKKKDKVKHGKKNDLSGKAEIKVSDAANLRAKANEAAKVAHANGNRGAYRRHAEDLNAQAKRAEKKAAKALAKLEPKSAEAQTQAAPARRSGPIQTESASPAEDFFTPYTVSKSNKHIPDNLV